MMLGLLRPSRGNVRMLSEDPKNVQILGRLMWSSFWFI